MNQNETQTYQFIAPIIYGPLTDLHRGIWDDARMRAICHNDDPTDVAELNRYHAN